MRGFGRVERVLFISGLVLVSICTVNRIYTALYAQTLLQSFWANQVSAQSQYELQANSRSVPPDFHLWSENRIKAYRASLLTNVSPPLGVLQISSLHLQVPVLEGTDDLTLDRAVGHISGTALPGESGNIGIAGHRDGFFRGLKDLQVGVAIDLHARQGDFRYVVDNIQIVSPSDVSVLAAGEKPSLTLVTCYPFYFVGSAPLRYIVHATAGQRE
jgi:sortase A